MPLSVSQHQKWPGRYAAAGGLAVCALALLVACEAPARELTLLQAVDEGWVIATFTSRATYGDALAAVLESTTEQPIRITVERGTRLRNDRPGAESFVIFGYRGRLEAPDGALFARATTIALNGAGAQEIALLEGYSLTLLADPATALDTFALDGMATGDVLAVVQAATGAESIEARQIAIWAATEDVTAKDLADVAFKHTAGDLDGARSILQRAGLRPATFKLFGSR